MAFSLFPSQSLTKNKIKCSYQNPASLDLLSNLLSKLIFKLDPCTNKELVVLGIGTDRSTGDSLGPLVGWFLQQQKAFFSIYGTLDEPVHAANLSDKLKEIERNHHNPLIIAVDACLGRPENVGIVTLSEGELNPGAGVHKKLPAVGNISFTGIVNVSGYMEFIVLQNTRLNIVMRMASLISNSIISGVKKVQRIRTLTN
ncbi:MAG: spore protease YyaC [Bacillota bacterium]|jgi:putative sporulation protein YyaC